MIDIDSAMTANSRAGASDENFLIFVLETLNASMSLNLYEYIIHLGLICETSHAWYGRILTCIFVAVRAVNSVEGDAYKMVYERHSRMRWPEFRLEVANGTHTTLGNIACSTVNGDKTPGKPIKLVPCLKGNHLPNTCFQSVDAAENEASVEADLINCVVVEISGQDANKVVTVSFVENRDNSSWNRAYVQPNDQIDIFLKKEEFSPLSGPGFTRWDSIWAYVDSRRDDNALMINCAPHNFFIRPLKQISDSILLLSPHRQLWKPSLVCL
jgi:hypothetical protein